jgi:hypothetical protein
MSRVQTDLQPLDKPRTGDEAPPDGWDIELGGQERHDHLASPDGVTWQATIVNWVPETSPSYHIASLHATRRAAGSLKTAEQEPIGHPIE